MWQRYSCGVVKTKCSGNGTQTNIETHKSNETPAGLLAASQTNVYTSTVSNIHNFKIPL